jgi:RNA polymerase sigma-70 factor (ECF subfamily)
MFPYMPQNHDQSLLDDAGGLREEALQELDARMRAGEQEALAEVFTTCRQRLRHVIDFRLDNRMRSRVDADDVLQEVFLAASQRLGHYAGSSYTSPFLWLRAILSQTMVELYRRHIGAQKRNPDQEVRIDAAPFPNATSTSLAIQLVGSATSPGERVARDDMMGMMERAIANMEPIDQEVLALRHFEELSNREVAEVLGIEQKAASIRYVRAIRRLKGVLTQMTAYFRNPR